MASKVSTPEKPEAVTLEAFGRDVDRRRTAAGLSDLPRNSGARRTQAKNALIEAVKDSGGTW